MKRKSIIVFFLFCSVIFFLSNCRINIKAAPHPYELRYPEIFGKPIIPAYNPMTTEGVWLGRLLFYDTLLSITGRMSCGSCHRQEFAFTDGRVTAIGVHGDTLKKNTMSLINLAWGKRFFWDGRAITLEEAARQPLAQKTEMGGKPDQELIRHLQAHPYYPDLFTKAFPGQPISINTISMAIAQFMRTIISKEPQSRALYSFKIIMKMTATKYDDQHSRAELEAMDSIAHKRNALGEDLLKENSAVGSICRVTLMQCHSCHVTEGFGGQIATVNEKDSLFKAPNFMNLKYTGPYFHDGRFKTLREVLQFYNDNMEALEIRNPDRMIHLKKRTLFNEYDLEHAEEIFAAFNDLSIIYDRAYSNPFQQKGFSWHVDVK